jgi:DtxR family Mn-dependent transcriptional regulator
MERSPITSAIEDYLRTIYALEEEIQPVIAARVAEEVGVTPSTMVSTLRRLEREGYLKVLRRKEIHLTTEGRQVAERILRRHFLLERFLTDLLGRTVKRTGTVSNTQCPRKWRTGWRNY